MLGNVRLSSKMQIHQWNLLVAHFLTLLFASELRIEKYGILRQHPTVLKCQGLKHN